MHLKYKVLDTTLLAITDATPCNFTTSQDIVTGKTCLTSKTSYQNAFTTNSWLHVQVP